LNPFRVSWDFQGSQAPASSQASTIHNVHQSFHTSDAQLVLAIVEHKFRPLAMKLT